MAFGLPDEVRALQARVRRFVDSELIPHEVHAEMNGGELPEGVAGRLERQAAGLGLRAMNIPKSLGGPGHSYLAQAIVSEQIGRVTNGLGWCVSTPARGIAEAATPHQLETWVKPVIRGERHECYAITEEKAGSDVDAIEGTARRDGETYVINAVKWHVTSYNHADHALVHHALQDVVSRKL